MKHQKYGAYLAAGVTAFAVIAAAILLFFVIYHFSAVRALLELLAYILRPIFYGLVLAFLLLPVHRQIYSFLAALCEGVAERGGRKRAALNFLAIVLSLIFAVLVVYVLLAMVLPQLYLSIVGLVNAVPEYIRIMQRWLLDFLADNPEIQAAVLPYYNSLAQSVEQWLSSDMLPNLESVNSTLDWLKAEILPQLTGVVSSVSSGVIALALLLKDILIAIIVSVYLLARKDVFAAQSKKIVYSVFRTNVADLLVEETRSAYRILSGFINGKLVDSLIIGIIALVCCNLFRFPYPMLLAVIIGVTNIIPFFGPFIGAIPCALLILLVSPLKCLYFVHGAGLLLGVVLHPAVRRPLRLCGHGAGRPGICHVLQRGQPPGAPWPEKTRAAPGDRAVSRPDRTPCGEGNEAERVIPLKGSHHSNDREKKTVKI